MENTYLKYGLGAYDAQILVDALKVYQNHLVKYDDDESKNKHFDCFGLIGAIRMAESIEITLEQYDIDNWHICREGVDRPEWLAPSKAEQVDKPISKEESAFLESITNIGWNDAHPKENLYILEQYDEDRIVFVTVDDKFNVVGLNYHMDSNYIDEYYYRPCPHMSEIYNRLGSIERVEDRIMKAIELYNVAFVDHEIFKVSLY